MTCVRKQCPKLSCPIENQISDGCCNYCPGDNIIDENDSRRNKISDVEYSRNINSQQNFDYNRNQNDDDDVNTDINYKSKNNHRYSNYNNNNNYNNDRYSDNFDDSESVKPDYR